MLLQLAIEKFITATCAVHADTETGVTYRRHLRPFMEFIGGLEEFANGCNVTDVTVDHLRSYLSHLANRSTLYTCHRYRSQRKGRLSPHTRATYFRMVKRFFSWLKEEGLIATDPSVRIPLLRPELDNMKAADEHAILKLLAACDDGTLLGMRDAALIAFFATTACRVGGVVNLRLCDLHLTQRRATVREKGGKSRAVFFSEAAQKRLAAWLEVRPQTSHDSVFVGLGPRSYSEKLSRSGIEQVFERRAKAARIAGPTNPHSLRHAYARRYLNNGGDLASLSNAMGHRKIDVTVLHYARFCEDELQAKAERFGMPLLGNDTEGGDQRSSA